MTSDDAARARLADLERREGELLDKLQRCIPPVDQHRHDLQIVRTQIATVRVASEEGRPGSETPTSGATRDSP